MDEIQGQTVYESEQQLKIILNFPHYGKTLKNWLEEITKRWSNIKRCGKILLGQW